MAGIKVRSLKIGLNNEVGDLTNVILHGKGFKAGYDVVVKGEKSSGQLSGEWTGKISEATGKTAKVELKCIVAATDDKDSPGDIIDLDITVTGGGDSGEGGETGVPLYP